MAFGFSQSEIEAQKNNDKIYWAILKYRSWPSLYKGQKVKSLLTEVEGAISKIDEGYSIIEIEWDNGNRSRANKEDLTKVIILEEKPIN